MSIHDLNLTNQAVSLLVGSINNSDDPVTFSITPADGNLKFPPTAGGKYFKIFVIKPDNTYEIMRVTSRSSDSMTADREQEGTTKLSFSAGAVVSARITASDLNALVAALPPAAAGGSAGEAVVTNGSAYIFGAGLASGDRLIFQQTTPGGSFVKDTGITSNSALRLITGTVTNDLTGSGFTTIFASRTSGNQSTNHGHTVTAAGANTPQAHTAYLAAGSQYGINASEHNHGFTGSAVNTELAASDHNHVTDFKVDYYDFTIGEAA